MMGLIHSVLFITTFRLLNNIAIVDKFHCFGAYEVAGKYERHMVWALGRDLFSPSWLSTSILFGKLQLVESVDTYAVSHYYGLMTRMDSICFHAALVDNC
jgi:hypothetical protein